MDEDKRLRDIRNEEWKKYCEENNIINPYKN
jgi:hypothetical protein